MREVRLSQLELDFYGLHGDVGSVPVMGRKYPPPVPRILRFLHRYGGYQASPQQEKTLLYLKARIFTVPRTANKHFRQSGKELIPADAPSDWSAVDPYPKRPPKDNLLEVFIKGERYPVWLTFEHPEHEQFFFKHRREFPILFGELKSRPAALCSVKAYDQRWYGFVLKECEGANTYKRRGRLEIQVKQGDNPNALDSTASLR